MSARKKRDPSGCIIMDNVLQIADDEMTHLSKKSSGGKCCGHAELVVNLNLDTEY